MLLCDTCWCDKTANMRLSLRQQPLRARFNGRRSSVAVRGMVYQAPVVPRNIWCVGRNYADYIKAKLREQQWPWTLAKSFPKSTPLGTPFAVEGLDLHQLELHLTVNGETRQRGSTSLKIPVLLDYIRKHFPVVPGDVVLTGTPAVVSALKAGDKVVAQVLSGSQVLSSGNWEVAAEDSIGQQATQKIVINACYGGFGLSKRALDAYARAKGLPLDRKYKEDSKYAGIGYPDDIPRDDPDLVRIVKELGRRANGKYCRLAIVEVPAGVRWQIFDYDGSEYVSEYLGVRRTWQ